MTAADVAAGYDRARHRLYAGFRATGMGAWESLVAARIVLMFREGEDERVRIVAYPEEESYWDVYGEPEGYVGRDGRRVSAAQERKEMEEVMDRLGVWVVSGEYCCARCGEWIVADSVGMCTGYERPRDPMGNEYVRDLMVSAMTGYDRSVDGSTPILSGACRHGE